MRRNALLDDEMTKFDQCPSARLYDSVRLCPCKSFQSSSRRETGSRFSVIPHHLPSMSSPKDSDSSPSTKAFSTGTHRTILHSALRPPPLSAIRSDWRALPPEAVPSPRSHIPSDQEIIDAITFVWCIHWNSFNTMDPAGLRARILAKHKSWHLLEKRVADVRNRALSDGRLRQPSWEVGVRMQPSMEEVHRREHSYAFDPHWRSARLAQVCKLRRSFEITSGT